VPAVGPSALLLITGPALARAPWKGDGPATIALTPKPADWTSPRGQDQSDGELFWKISTGRGAMPSWKHLPERERWAELRFIKTLKKWWGLSGPPGLGRRWP
jgi:hypothetical protein